MLLPKFQRVISAVFAIGILQACAGGGQMGSMSSNDEFQWLENSELEKTQEWIAAENKRSETIFQKDPKLPNLQEQIKSILEDDDKIHQVQFIGDWVYNYDRSRENPKGVWRRADQNDYLAGKENWEVVLDFDKLSAQDGETWVFKQANCNFDRPNRCLIRMSRGGLDKSITREFDTDKKEFVKGGFDIPESFGWADWRDKDSLWVSYAVNDFESTDVGRPRAIRRLERGGKLEETQPLFVGEKTDMSTHAYSVHSDFGTQYHFILRSIDFWNREYYRIQDDEVAVDPLPIPTSSRVQDIFKGHLIIELKEPWLGFSVGAVLAIAMEQTGKKELTVDDVALIYQPQEKESIAWIRRSKHRLYLVRTVDVKSRVTEVRWLSRKWHLKDLDFPQNGSVWPMASHYLNKSILFTFSDFLTPSRVYHRFHDQRLDVLKSLPEKFDRTGMVIRQFFARSVDGTEVPYFWVGPEKVEGPIPTHMYGYGGFEYGLQPHYNPNLGKALLEAGVAYVLTNIRGGGEYGPKWHRAAMLENKQRSYDDFIAIAENLVERGLAKSGGISIQGGSNGGLMVGAVMTQRPDLFNGVVCERPLLDMIRYTKLPPGNSWIAEYGDPEDPKMRSVIEKYSPYQNLRESAEYPRMMLFTTATDDRVHPGHARKFAARMKDFGHDYLFVEEQLGGHGGNADLNLRAAEEARLMRFILNSHGL